MLASLTGFTTPFSNISHSKETVADIYAKVESLEINWLGYTLGAQLTDFQKKIAKTNPLPSETSGIYKFKDRELNIVADSKTDRVLIMFQAVEDASQQRVRDILGSLVLQFKDPTLYAHDKIVYWAYGEYGKYSSDQFEAAKQQVKNRQDILTILGTVKLQSEIPITKDISANSSGKVVPQSGRVYYIISSEALLKQMN